MPPKSKASKPQGPQYLFVNEDANTVLRNTKDVELDRSKQSHVQRHNLARRKRLKAQASPSGNMPFTQDPGTPSLVSLQSEQRDPAHYLQDTDFSDFSIYDDNFANFLDRTPLPLEYFDPQDSNQTLPSSITSWSAADLGFDCSTGQMTVFGNSASEPSQSNTNQSYLELATIHRNTRSPSLYLPFESTIYTFKNTKLALEQWAPPLIQYYTTVIIPSMFNIDSRAFPLQAMRHAPALHADMQACMSEAAHMYALLAAASARMLSEEGRLFLPNVTEENFVRVPLFFKTKAVEALRHKLSWGELDPLVVVDVYRLMAASLFLNDTAAADAHLQTLLQMIDALGGLHTFDDYTRERLILLDIYGATQALSAARFPMDWDPGQLPEQTLARISLSSEVPLALTGTRLMSTSTSDLFHQDMLASIIDLTQLVHMAFHPAAQAEYTQSDFSWMTLRTAAIEHRLLSFARPEKGDDNLKQECTRITLIFWIGMTLGDLARKTTAARMAHVLKESLDSSELLYQWRHQTDLLLWIATIGALTVNNEIEHSWFMELASKAAHELKLTTLGGYEEVLQGFFYVADLQHESLASLFGHFEYISKPLDRDPQSHATLQQESKGKSKEIG